MTVHGPSGVGAGFLSSQCRNLCVSHLHIAWIHLATIKADSVRSVHCLVSTVATEEDSFGNRILLPTLKTGSKLSI